METVDSVSIHRLREALGPDAVLLIKRVAAPMDGSDYHMVYALLITPKQMKKIEDAVQQRGI